MMDLSWFPGECVAEVSRSLWDADADHRMKKHRFGLELYSCLKEPVFRHLKWKVCAGVYHCIPPTVFFLCSKNTDFGALWWLQWRTALQFFCCPTAPMLRRSVLQRRVTGVRVVGVFAQRTGPGAEDKSSARKKGAPQQRQPTAGAAKTGLHSMPALPLVRHLTLVDT